MGKSRFTDMTEGSPLRHIVLFSIPLVIGNLFQQLYNVVDSVVVGNFVGKTALAAVGTGFPILFMVSSLFMGLGMGATVMISQFYGADDLISVRKTVDTLYTAIMVGMIPLTIIGLLVSGPLLELMQVPADTMADAKLYIMILFGGMFSVLGYNVNAGILQGLGDSRAPLLFLTIACGINIILDLVFVIVFSMGVAGVALATIIAQTCSWFFGIWYINKKYLFLEITPFKLKFDKDIFKKVMRLGIPTAIQQAVFSLGIMVMQSLVNSFGSDFMAGFNGANKIDTMVFLPIQSISAAVTTYVGQNIGANRMDRVKKGVHSGMSVSLILSIALGALMFFFGESCMRLFSQEQPVIDAGVVYLKSVVPCCFLLSIMLILNSTMRGAGAVLIPTVASLISLWAARVPMAHLLVRLFGRDAMFYSYGIGWAIADVIVVAYYLSGKWKNKSIVKHKESLQGV